MYCFIKTRPISNYRYVSASIIMYRQHVFNNNTNHVYHGQHCLWGHTEYTDQQRRVIVPVNNTEIEIVTKATQKCKKKIV